MYLLRTSVIFTLLTLSMFSQHFEFAGETLFMWNGPKLYRQAGATLSFNRIDPGNGTDNINTLFFVSPAKGYLAAGLKFFRTTDSGLNWLPVLDNVSINNSGKIAAMGDMLLVLTPDNKILRSYNSGASFDTVSLDLPVPLNLLMGFMGGSSAKYTVLYAPDFNPFTGQMNYLLSTDSCKTWSLTSTFGEKGRSRFISERHGFIVTPVRVYTTSNGGSSWNIAFEMAANLMPAGGYWADSVTAYQATYNSGKLYRTTNGGTTWSMAYSGSADVGYVNAGGNCVVIKVENESVFRYSSDRGITWVVMDTATSVDDAAPGYPGDFALTGNYPNPFNGSTVISFTSGSDGTAELSVFNANGTLVDKIRGIDCMSGLNRIRWESKELPSGIYFYSLRFGHSPGTALTGKMILLK